MENQYFSRWYDKDPVLSMSMRTLSTSDDATQISVALNLIKINLLFQAKYLTFLPTKEELVNEIERQKMIFRLQQKDNIFEE